MNKKSTSLAKKISEGLAKRINKAKQRAMKNYNSTPEKRAEVAAQTPIPGEERYDPAKNAKLKQDIKRRESVDDPDIAVTSPDSIKGAGGSSDIYKQIKAKKDAKKAAADGQGYHTFDTKGGPRRDRRAGPKGHSRRNTLERPAMKSPGAEKFKKGLKTGAMPKNPAADQGGNVRGKSINTSRSDLPGEKAARLANRKNLAAKLKGRFNR